ncbi:MAG: ECF transporter S component [Clostridia bacterium]|nr:ECF transporter S component [Clostridia bacterium]
MCLALCMVLPYLTGQIPEIGNLLLPMHIPVLLCGMLCGWPWGLAVGFIAPLMRSLLFGMPPFYPTALAMAFELAAYGFASGLFSRLLPKKIPFVYLSLILAMIAGRLVWGVARFVMAGLSVTAFPFSAFLAGAITTAWPGMLLQVLILPPIVILLRRTKLAP